LTTASIFKTGPMKFKKGKNSRTDHNFLQEKKTKATRSVHESGKKGKRRPWSGLKVHSTSKGKMTRGSVPWATRTVKENTNPPRGDKYVERKNGRRQARDSKVV